ncbi:helix-turn-helix domain-containing protein [Lactococcus garvieae]|uniref:helix-turn-helix domain-containing protein n=1 Tax=Lactococcus garvieae TaxID=1363 RepID=UPI003D76BD15
MTVFENIKSLAKSRHITMKDLAIELGFSENLFYTWKKTNPKASDLAKVADYFHVSVDYLLGREEIRGEILDDTEEQLIAAFRFEGKDLDEEGKARLNRSVQTLIRAARENIQDVKKRGE